MRPVELSTRRCIGAVQHCVASCDHSCTVAMQGVRVTLRASESRFKAWEASMRNSKSTSKRKQRKQAVPVVGVVGALSLVGGTHATAAVATSDPPRREAPPPQITLSEEEIADVSLGTFFVFDKETAGTPRYGPQLARCGCGGCHRGCGGCRGCRGCGRGCGCGGCGG